MLIVLFFFFKVFHDGVSESFKNLLNVDVLLCTCLDKVSIVLLCEDTTLVGWDLSLLGIGRRELAFVCNDNSWNCFFCFFAHLKHPICNVFKGFSIVHTIYEDHTRNPMVVTISYIAESLLPSCVPDLKLHIFILMLDCFGFEIKTDRGCMTKFILSNSIPSIPKHYTRFSNWWIPNNNNLCHVTMVRVSFLECWHVFQNLL